MTFATVPQPLIQGFSPAAPVAGMAGKLVEGLAQKLGQAQRQCSQRCLPLLGDRRNAKQLLRLLGGLKTIPIRAKGRHQARGQDCTRPGRLSNRGRSGCLPKITAIWRSKRSMAPSKGRSCWTSAWTIIDPDSRAAGSVVRERAWRICSSRRSSCSGLGCPCSR